MPSVEPNDSDPRSLAEAELRSRAAARSNQLDSARGLPTADPRPMEPAIDVEDLEAVVRRRAGGLFDVPSGGEWVTARFPTPLIVAAGDQVTVSTTYTANDPGLLTEVRVYVKHSDGTESRRAVTVPPERPPSEVRYADCTGCGRSLPLNNEGRLEIHRIEPARDDRIGDWCWGQSA